MLKELTPSREDIANAMLFCLERADAAEEVVGHITESFSLLQTPLQKKASLTRANLYINEVPQNAQVIIFYRFFLVLTDRQIVSCVGHLAQLMCQSSWCIVLS